MCADVWESYHESDGEDRSPKAHDANERELAELGEECARVLLLLQRLAKARAAGNDANDILGELSAIVVHLHVHTKGLDRLIDRLASS